MTERMPRLQKFARGLAWLRANDPARHTRLQRAVKRYARYAKLFGASDGDVPPTYRFFATARYVIIESLVLVLGLPLAIVGTILWYPTWYAPNVTLRMVKPDHDAISTYKLATGFAMVPATLAITGIVAGILAGPLVAALAVTAAIILGFVTIGWRERWDRVQADATLFVRVLTRSRERKLLSAERAALVTEFDAVLERIET